MLNAKGDIVVMLNSGDAFYSKDVISIVTTEFDNDPALQWLHSKYELHRGNILDHNWQIVLKIKNVQGNAEYLPPNHVYKKNIA